MIGPCNTVRPDHPGSADENVEGAHCRREVIVSPMARLERRLAVARGDEPADTVVRGGRVLCVFTREWLDADVAIVDGVIAGIGDVRRRRGDRRDRAATSCPGSSTRTCTSSR